MPEVNLGGMGRYERRIRALWSAEPQRGEYTDADEKARDRLAEACDQHSLDFWAVIHNRGMHLPSEGSFVYTSEFFGILGICVVAFPSAELRDEFVELNERCEAVPDDKFWP